MKTTQKVMVMFIIAALSLTGCMKPYDVPEFAEVGPNETAFVVPLEGDTAKQDVFASIDLLAKSKVGAKRIEITHRAVSVGRMIDDIKYVPTIAVIKLDRTPVTVTWMPPQTGAAGGKGHKYLSAESKDSIAVGSGFTLTARIPEDLAVKYLYLYRTKPLNQVVEEQVFNLIQSVYASECAKYDLLDLRAKKQEITDAIRSKVLPAMKDWGIEVSPEMGIVGGLTYENASIQGAIDQVFIAQNQKTANEALKAAQTSLNERDLGIAANAAQIKIVSAEGEAKAIEKVALAVQSAGMPYLTVRQIEVAQKATDKWNGVMPQMSMGSATPISLFVPALDTTKAADTKGGK
jgi:PBP1b-binding outer membrane lipoprotein LpoB